jgi:hypothetical protein
MKDEMTKIKVEFTKAGRSLWGELLTGRGELISSYFDVC